MGKDRRSIREKIVDLMVECGALEKRITVVPPKRASGPKVTPPDWYLEEVNKLLPKRDEPEVPPAA